MGVSRKAVIIEMMILEFVNEKIVKEAAESRIDVKEVSLCTKA